MKPAGAPRALLFRGLSLLAVALVPAYGFNLIVGHMPAKAVLLVCCAGTVFAGSLLHPTRSLADGAVPTGPLGRALLLGAISGIVMASQVSILENHHAILRLMAAAAILGFLVDRAVEFLAALTGARRSAPMIATLGLGLAGSAPIWLGPWAEYLSGHALTSNAMIWLSPLTYLAVMAEYDYLRGQWFYMYTPFGGLRYAYPGQLTYCAVYMLLGGLFWFAERVTRRKRAAELRAK